MADNSLQSLEELTPTPETSSTNTLGGTPENGFLQDTLSSPPSPRVESENAPLASNIFLDTSTVEHKEESDKDERSKFVSRYIRRFIIASFITVINVILIGIIFVYDTYITQTSKLKVEKYETLVSSTKEYLQLITSYLGYNYESKYATLPLLIPEHERNLQNIITTSELSYAEKKDILKGKVSSLVNTVTNQVGEIEEIKKNIAKFGFLPQEIREILHTEDTVPDIQRSLSSLEIIKFSTALKVFSYLDSVITLMADNTKMAKDTLSTLLMSLSDRGEKDVSAYVYMCYLNPFEITQDCSSIGDFDLYYQDILKETDFNRGIFKNIMKYIDVLLEHSDIPSFSILFHGSNAGQQTINFTIEINTTKQDELKLIEKDTNRRIKNPHIFILTNLINLLKQSVFIIGGDINTTSIDITTRPIMIGNTTYTVNTSSKTFDLPIQKTTEREIFDYIDLSALLQALSTGGVLMLPEIPTEYQSAEEGEEVASEFPADTSVEQSDLPGEWSNIPVEAVGISAEQSSLSVPSSDSSEETLDLSEEILSEYSEETFSELQEPLDNNGTLAPSDTQISPESTGSSEEGEVFEEVTEFIE